MQVFLYVDLDGTARLSLHLDTGRVPDWLLRDDAVPLIITVNGHPVFQSEDQEP